MAAEDAGRAVAWSRQLARAHAVFGSNCTICGQILARRKPGGGLLAHCLAFCSALPAYHQGEEAGLFAELLRPGPAFGMLRGSWLMIIR